MSRKVFSALTKNFFRQLDHRRLDKKVFSCETGGFFTAFLRLFFAHARTNLPKNVENGVGLSCVRVISVRRIFWAIFGLENSWGNFACRKLRAKFVRVNLLEKIVWRI